MLKAKRVDQQQASAADIIAQANGDGTVIASQCPTSLAGAGYKAHPVTGCRTQQPYAGTKIVPGVHWYQTSQALSLWTASRRPLPTLPSRQQQPRVHSGCQPGKHQVSIVTAGHCHTTVPTYKGAPCADTWPQSCEAIPQQTQTTSTTVRHHKQAVQAP